MPHFIPHADGKQAESRACDFLKAKGLRLIAKNFRTTLGEIDLIMKEDNILVFIEVRSRKSSVYGESCETIGRIKKAKIIKTASIYLKKEKLCEKIDCRFDVVTIDYIKDKIHGDIRWIRDAFQVE